MLSNERRAGLQPGGTLLTIATALLCAPALAQVPDLAGDWDLYFNGQRIDSAQWTTHGRKGTEVGEPISGSYTIVSTPALSLIKHGETVWLIIIPVGGLLDTRRNADGYTLGPDFGTADALQIRPVREGRELEIWADDDGLDARINLVFTGYTLRPALYEDSFGGAADDFVF